MQEKSAIFLCFIHYGVCKSRKRAKVGVAKKQRVTLITSHLPRTYLALTTHLSRTNFCLRIRWYYILSI